LDCEERGEAYLGPPSKLLSPHVELENEAKYEEATVIDTTSGRDEQRSVQEYRDIDVADPRSRPSPGYEENSHWRKSSGQQGIGLRMID
jgi:hypothetical protein